MSSPNQTASPSRSLIAALESQTHPLKTSPSRASHRASAPCHNAWAHLQRSVPDGASDTARPNLAGEMTVAAADAAPLVSLISRSNPRGGGVRSCDVLKVDWTCWKMRTVPPCSVIQTPLKSDLTKSAKQPFRLVLSCGMMTLMYIVWI